MIFRLECATCLSSKWNEYERNEIRKKGKYNAMQNNVSENEIGKIVEISRSLFYQIKSKCLQLVRQEKE